MKAPRRFRPLLATAALIPLVAAVGCTPSHTYVLDASATDLRTRTVAISSAAGTVKVDPDLMAKFDAELRSSLSEKPALAVKDAAPLRIEYRFVHNDPGNTAVRVGSNIANIVGSPVYGFGDGAVAVEVQYFDANNKPCGRIVSDGAIAGSFGTASQAAKKTAQAIATYTKDHYAEMMAATH